MARTPPPTEMSDGVMRLEDDEKYYDTEYCVLRKGKPGYWRIGCSLSPILKYPTFLLSKPGPVSASTTRVPTEQCTVKAPPGGEDDVYGPLAHMALVSRYLHYQYDISASRPLMLGTQWARSLATSCSSTTGTGKERKIKRKNGKAGKKERKKIESRSLGKYGWRHITHSSARAATAGAKPLFKVPSCTAHHPSPSFLLSGTVLEHNVLPEKLARSLSQKRGPKMGSCGYQRGSVWLGRCFVVAPGCSARRSWLPIPRGLALSQEVSF
ncbi:hypothetical protein HOY80DRAFT_1005849 [Tuber brumale]|nr:hypothetical protein HOY80DRAFT_1005849 [Tuber brumale]